MQKSFESETDILMTTQSKISYNNYFITNNYRLENVIVIITTTFIIQLLLMVNTTTLPGKYILNQFCEHVHGNH